MSHSIQNILTALRQDMDRWERDLRTSEAEGFTALSDQLKAWLAEGRKIIAANGVL